jgi:pSer/pThr/pTyr-binding forkhead associated (FHA) protein
MHKLILQKGPYPGQEFMLTKGDVAIGRGGGVEISIPMDGVSHLHARLLLRGGRYWIEDLGSKNGTLLNGRKLTDRISLNSGDKIDLGKSVTLIYEGT